MVDTNDPRKKREFTMRIPEDVMESLRGLSESTGIPLEKLIENGIRFILKTDMQQLARDMDLADQGQMP
jgi:imidazolonepropionase-like amidohydrolase